MRHDIRYSRAAGQAIRRAEEVGASESNRMGFAVAAAGGIAGQDNRRRRHRRIADGDASVCERNKVSSGIVRRPVIIRVLLLGRVALLGRIPRALPIGRIVRHDEATQGAESTRIQRRERGVQVWGWRMWRMAEISEVRDPPEGIESRLDDDMRVREKKNINQTRLGEP